MLESSQKDSYFNSPFHGYFFSVAVKISWIQCRESEASLSQSCQWKGLYGSPKWKQHNKLRTTSSPIGSLPHAGIDVSSAYLLNHNIWCYPNRGNAAPKIDKCFHFSLFWIWIAFFPQPICERFNCLSHSVFILILTVPSSWCMYTLSSGLSSRMWIGDSQRGGIDLVV